MASKIIPASNNTLFRILIPNRGKLLKNNGSRAQCMAQANAADTPIVSQLIFNFIRSAKIISLQHSCKIFYLCIVNISAYAQLIL